jgi:hypothetical protein
MEYDVMVREGGPSQADCIATEFPTIPLPPLPPLASHEKIRLDFRFSFICFRLFASVAAD